MNAPKNIYIALHDPIGEGYIPVRNWVDATDFTQPPFDCIEYRLVEDCVWRVSSSIPMFKDTFLYKTGCGHEGVSLIGDYCSCGGKIVVKS